ncbi:MAG TPA: hypothetical protein VFV94_06940, partial [Polyangiaceae bacterium]|nr:hypothetical protein [Polyangiaceae bacterium]
MPLEFALRPHFDLDRPVRRRRVVRSRFLRLAVPTAAYWLAIAGATYAFVSSVGEHSPAEDTEARSAPDVERLVEPVASPPPALAPIPQGPEADSTNEPAPLPPPEPAPPPAPAPETTPEPALAARPAFVPNVASPAPAPPPSLRAEPRAPRVATSPSVPRLAAPDPFAMQDPFAMPDPFARNESPVAARSDPAGAR